MAGAVQSAGLEEIAHLIIQSPRKTRNSERTSLDSGVVQGHVGSGNKG